jgi:hypothetical protein
VCDRIAGSIRNGRNRLVCRRLPLSAPCPLPRPYREQGHWGNAGRPYFANRNRLSLMAGYFVASGAEGGAKPRGPSGSGFPHPQIA